MVSSRRARIARLTITFDDGFVETFGCVRPLLKEYKIPATFNVIAGLLGRNFQGIPTVSVQDLLAARSDEMEIGSHGYYHLRPSVSIRSSDYSILEKVEFLIRKTADLKIVQPKLAYLREGVSEVLLRVHETRPVDIRDLFFEAYESKRLLDHVLNQDTVTFAYPGGKVLKRLSRMLNSTGYFCARTTFRGYNCTQNHGDLYSLKSMIWMRGLQAKHANLWLDNAVSSSSWLIETLHLVSDSDSRRHKGYRLFDTDVKEFEEHLRYVRGLVDKGVLVCGTQGQFASLMRRGC